MPPIPASTLAAPKRLIIASRESRLALWQAHYVQDCLKKLYPDCDVQILGMTTRGDQILDRALSKVGGKGLFVKELEQALYEKDFEMWRLNSEGVRSISHLALMRGSTA